jgi:hypothetical protein
LHYSPNIVGIITSKRVRLVGHVARIGAMRNVYKVLVRKPEGNIPLGRLRRRWEDNIKMDLKRNRLSEYGFDSNGS